MRSLAWSASAALALLAASRDRAELRFAWPEETRAKVSYTAARTRVGARGATSSSRKTWTYDVHVRRRNGELLIQRTDTRLPRDSPVTGLWQKVDSEGKPVPNFNEVQDLIDEVTERIPVVVVAADGEFLRVEGTEPIRKELESMLKRSGLPRETQERVRGLFTESALGALAKEQWGTWVGFWRNLPLQRGRAIAQKRRGVFPGTDYPIELVVEGRLEGFIKCRASEKARKCVELTMVSRPDAEQVARTIERLNLSATAGIRKLSLEQTFTVVTRPETLLPYHCTRELSAEIEHAPGSGEATRSETLTETWGFDYSPAPGEGRPRP